MSINILDLYHEINMVREMKKLEPCQIRLCLEKAASKHAEDMFNNGFVSHIGSDRSNYIERVHAFNPEVMPTGEIICKGPGGKNCIENVVIGWLNSPGHAEIMLDPKQTYFGAGYRLKNKQHLGNYWVVVFA